MTLADGTQALALFVGAREFFEQVAIEDDRVAAVLLARSVEVGGLNRLDA